MMQDIERIHYYRDDQIPQIMFFRAIQQRFRLADVRCGIVNVDGPKLVILDRQRKFYLICKHESTDILQTANQESYGADFHFNTCGNPFEENRIHH